MTYSQLISINGTVLTEQPSSINENPTLVYSDQTSISGYKERQTFGSRKKVEMNWNYASPTTARYFLALFNAGTAVTYENASSPMYNGANTFTGVLTTNAGEYLRGGSGLTKLKVTIEEGANQA